MKVISEMFNLRPGTESIKCLRDGIASSDRPLEISLQVGAEIGW